ncbi:GT2 family glycosyltransferase [Bradyrhizobium ottawaense]|uniref:glycosyltransferase n=1 Tax=Bradyrhizobium ottawaense TaxID=931866 RepID=UPI0035176DC6
MSSAYHDDEGPHSDRQLDLSIIVVSYNTRDMTLDCLASIAAETMGTRYEVIVVDNNSSDQSAAAIARQFPDIRLIALNDNIGFARRQQSGCKTGARPTIASAQSRHHYSRLRDRCSF